MKKETYANGNLMYTTYYVRDVAGQPMAVYSDVGGNPDLAEQPVYGAGRIGIAYNGNNNQKNYVYELADHLGNVRVVFTKEDNDAVLEGFTDYYPFGMPMPNRTLLGPEGYRYAFQGQEKDPETRKEAFQLRLWDGRIGRWLTTDLYGQYASPYLGIGNNPINRVDPNGGKDCSCKTGKNRPFDWYMNLATNQIEWFDGSFDIEGYERLGFDYMETSIDSYNNRRQIKYDGATKSSYLYNSTTADFDFLESYDHTTSDIDLLMSFVNSPIIVSDQFSGAFVNGFQGTGIALYEGTVNGRDLNGLKLQNLGYEPALNIESTRIYNNGKWININIHGNGMQEFAALYAANLIKLSPFKANLLKNKWLDQLLSSKMKTVLKDYIED